MPHNQLKAFAHAEQTAQAWLSAVAARLGTSDLEFTYRVLRAWLHATRDRLTVDGAAHFASQLPELLRGVFYDGWAPSRVPVKFDAAEYIERFAAEARVSPGDVRYLAPIVSAAMAELCSPGTLDVVLARFPNQLRSVLRPAPVTPR